MRQFIASTNVKKTPKVDLMAKMVQDWTNQAEVRALFYKELHSILDRKFRRKPDPKKVTGGLMQHISTMPATDDCMKPTKFDRFLKGCFKAKRRKHAKPRP